MCRTFLSDALRNWRSARLGKREIIMRGSRFDSMRAADVAIRCGEVVWTKAAQASQKRAAQCG